MKEAPLIPCPEHRVRTRRVIALLAIALGSARAGIVGVVGSAAAGEYEQKQGQAMVRISSESSDPGRVEIRLSDQLIVTLSVEGRSPLDAELSRTAPSPASWQLRGRSSVEHIRLNNGRERWQQKLYFDPLKAGDVPLALTPLRFSEGSSGEPWQEVAWQPVPVRVSTEVVEPDVSQLRDITPPEQVPPRASWYPFVYAVIGVFSLVAVLALGWGLLRRRTRSPATLPPDRWALRELQRITWPASYTDREVERYYTRLSDIIRTYLENRFQVPAPEQTTPEFLEAIRQSPMLTQDQQHRLRDFMERCDLVKYARWVPSEEECRAAAAMAWEFVQETAAMRSE
jgi:hypothetical protein